MSNDDEPILVKQIIVTLSYVYNQGLTFTTRDIELYPDEFEYYDPEDSYIFIYMHKRFNGKCIICVYC